MAPETAASVRAILPDGSSRELPAGSSALDLARSIGERLARDAVVARVGGTLVDLKAPLPREAAVEIVTSSHPDALGVLRHSTAHAVAQAVQELFPRRRSVRAR